MKKLILCLLISLQVAAALAQEEQLIQKDFQTIIGYTRKMEIDKVLDMTYPPLFKVMPKVQMSAMANGALSGMGIKTIFEEVPIGLTLSLVTKLGAATICLGKYNQSMILESSQAALLDMLAKAKMKDNTVERVNTDKLRIKGKSYLLAIKDANTGNTWKYMRYDDEDAETNAKVLSKEISVGATKLKLSLK
ncbi:hypothetical protein EZ449_13995 [Pedobacter frigidisoli]|uniref:Uncharacterized protein n=1 Tax=Pedobacter frigidisoli TaxID=2530455 RepID=A0A4R0P3B7_9SPHI|nr:hypothetical protein [Pedobacter frigidisoli]TCD07644.1 hypothetical protein EZ449_13995 [Pedobacter frigidisoli]